MAQESTPSGNGKSSMEQVRRVLARLSMGSQLQLEFAGLAGRVASTLTGIQQGRFLLVSIGRQETLTAQAIYPFLFTGNPLKCYTAVPGEAAVFESHVIRFVMSPFPLLFLRFPSELHTVNVRQHARFPCFFEAALHAGEGMLEGVITDLSLGGCSFTHVKAAAGDAAAGRPARLECWQIGADGADMPEVLVRSREEHGGCERLGVRFEAVPGAVTSILERLVRHAREIGLE